MTLSQVQDATAMVSDLKKSCRKLTAWSRQKLRMGWCNLAKVAEIPFRRASQTVRQNDPGYRPDIDIIDAVLRPMPAELSRDDEDKPLALGRSIR